MAKQIKATDIFEKEDVFAGIRKSAEDAIDTLGRFKDELKQTADELKKTIGGATVGDTKSINELIAATQKANQVKEQTVKIDQEQEKLRKLSIQSEREEIKLKKEQQAALDREAKAREKVSRETAKQNSAYSQESARLNELRKRYKDLAVQNKENTAEARNLLTQITALDGKLKQIDATVGQHQRNVGNYQQALGKLSGFLGQFGVAFGFGAAVQDSFKTIKEFDEANADMAKTLGISTEEAAKLSMEFTKLGSVTSIQGLQEIATIGGQFGISADQIGGFVSSMDKLNVALGGDFGSVEETAKQLGALRNIFTDIKTENIDQDLLGIGNALNELSSKGAKVEVVSDFANRISGLATPLGVTAGEILGLSATLAKLNVNAERGGTAVGTIFQRMTQDAAGFAEVAGVSTEEFTNLLNTDMVGAFKLVAKSFDGMKGDNVLMSKTLESLKLTGSGASEVFLKMASNTELLDANVKLSTESLKEQNSILQEVEKKSSTVGASVAKLGNAWDNFILGVNDGTGAQNGLINFFDFLAKYLPVIISTVAKLAAAWALYKTITLGLQALDKARAFSFKAFTQQMLTQIPLTKQYATAQREAAAAAKASGESAKAAGSAMSAVPWMAILGVLIEVAIAFYDIASNAKAARDAQQQLDAAIDAGQEQSAKRVSKRQEDLQKEIAALQRLRNENKISEEDFLKRKQYSLNLTQKEIQTDIKAVNERRKGYQQELKTWEERSKNAQSIVDENGKIISIESKIAEIRAKIGGANAKIAEYRKELNSTTETVKDATSEVIANDNAQSDNNKTTAKTISKKKEEVKVNQDLLKSLKDLRKEYQNQTFTDRALLTLEKERNAERLKAEFAVSTDADKDAQLKEALLLNEEDYQRKLKALIESEDIVEAETKVNELRFKAKNAKGLELIALTVQLKEAELKLLNEQEEKELLDAGKNEELKAKIRSEYALKRQEVEANYALKSIEEENKTEDKRIEIQKMSAEQRNEWAKFATDYFIKMSDERIAQLDKEIAAAEKQQDTLRELAANGNINARESLAENQRIIDEANRKKAQEERRKQMIELVSGVYQTYNQKVAANAENPLMETIRDTVLLQQFANTLLGNMPTFFDGTENTGKHGEGVDGKGGFHAILHPNERVVPKSLNEKIGSLSNEQLAKVAQEYQNGKLITGTQQMSAIDLSLLVNKMDELTHTIRNKPETNIELGEITSSVMEIVKTTKQGNTLKTNRFKIRK
jgi:TP901 family phage tail tape measure protein